MYRLFIPIAYLLLGTISSAQVQLTGSVSISATAAGSIRNVLQQPFASNSIWNTPIGSSAVYAPANITPATALAQDENILILTPTAPSTNIATSAAAWQSGVNRCDFTTWPISATSLYLPIPTNFVLTQTTLGGGTPNESGAILAADGQTIISLQPLQRCTAGGPLTYMATAISANTNLYTDGIAGTQGGSALSSLGGTIRIGELSPGGSQIINGVSAPIRHVLKFEFNHGLFSAFTSTYVWPASQGDGASEGLLLALLPAFDFNSLQTAPARSIAWTLINYGAYLVDDSNWDALQIAMELSTTSNDGTINREYTQFQTDWGYSFDQYNNTSTAWAQDIATIERSLQVITNNGPSNIGGGGTPRQPLLPSVTAPN